MTEISANETNPVAECPLCLRPMPKPHKCKTLYDVKVCKKCRNGFANRRQAAYVVDILLYMLAATLLFVVAVSLQSSLSGAGAGLRVVTTAAPRSPAVAILMTLLQWVVLPFIFLLKDSFNGYSPGKRLFGVRVVDSVSRIPIGPRQSIRRNLLLWIPYIGFICAVLTMMRGQRWGDKWANTMVIWEKHQHRVPFSPEGRYCRQCGYDLTGNVSGRCSECGLPIALPTAVSA